MSDRLDDLMLSSTWRDNSERSRLIELNISLQKRLRLAESELRDRVRAEEAFLAGHPREAELMARVRELESIVQRQNELRARGKAS